MWLGKGKASCHGEEEPPPPAFALAACSATKMCVVQRPVMPILVLRVGISHEPVALTDIGKNLVAVRNNSPRLRVGRLVVCDRIESSNKRLVTQFLALRAGRIHEHVALARAENSRRGEE